MAMGASSEGLQNIFELQKQRSKQKWGQKKKTNLSNKMKKNLDPLHSKLIHFFFFTHFN
jgi:hypothetical protein